MNRPLSTRVLPKWVPGAYVSVPKLKHAPYKCFDEVVFISSTVSSFHSRYGRLSYE